MSAVTARLSGALLLLLVLGALPAAAAPAAGGEGTYRAAAPGVLDGAESRTAYQVAGCFQDPAGDTFRLQDGQPVPEPLAAVDIASFCVDYDDADLDLVVSMPGGTDPATDPAWDDFQSAIALVYTAANGATREVQLSTQGDDDVFQYIVLEGTVGEPECEGPANHIPGEGYSASIPAGCLGAPDVMELVLASVYGGRTDGVRDVAPYDGGTVALPRQAPAGVERVTRLAGATRLETAIQTSRESFADGGAQEVLLASADNFPDAVVGAPLAVARQAPVLLTPPESLPDDVAAEILRALGGPGQVTILGGTAAVADGVVDALEAEGHTVDRVAGDSRFATSVEIASAAAESPRAILLAGGGSFPDALLAGAYSPSSPFDGVAVLVTEAGIPGVVQDYLDANADAQVIAVGAVAAAAAPEGTQAVVGIDPADTSAGLARSVQGYESVTIATYEQFPDGLAGGAYAASRGLPLLLSPRDAMTVPVLDALELRGPFADITLFGGTAALSDTVAGQAAAFLR